MSIIGATCFAWCYKLSDINLKEGLTEIRSYAFYQCALDNVVVPSTVRTVGENAFGNMSTLNTITFKKYLNADGTIRLPDIHTKAFISNTLTINVPWSETEHKAKYGDSIFGATSATFNFN